MWAQSNLDEPYTCSAVHWFHYTCVLQVYPGGITRYSPWQKQHGASGVPSLGSGFLATISVFVHLPSVLVVVCHAVMA